MSGSRRNWTKEEEQYIRDHWEDQTLDQMSDHLKIAWSTIRRHALVVMILPRKRKPPSPYCKFGHLKDKPNGSVYLTCRICFNNRKKKNPTT